MVYRAIATTALKAMMGRLPGWLTRRLLPAAQMVGQIHLSLRDDTPITFSQTSAGLQLDLWFAIVNHSPIDVTLERLLIEELWVSQPILYHGALLRRRVIPKNGGRSGDLVFHAFLADAQIKHIASQVEQQLITQPVTVYVSASFESAVGLLALPRTALERREVPYKYKTAAPAS